MHGHNEEQHDDSLSQWVGEAAIKGKRQAFLLFTALTTAHADGSADGVYGRTAVYVYVL